MVNKWLVRCLPVMAFAADQSQAHVQVLWPPNKRQSTRVQIEGGMQEQAVLCAQNVTRLLASALQHRPSKASCNHHDCTVIIRHKITTSSASENQEPPQRAQASSTLLQGIRFISITSKNTTLSAVVPKHERQKQNKGPQKIDSGTVHVAHFQSSSSKLHHNPTFS